MVVLLFVFERNKRGNAQINLYSVFLANYDTKIEEEISWQSLPEYKQWNQTTNNKSSCFVNDGRFTT